MLYMVENQLFKRNYLLEHLILEMFSKHEALYHDPAVRQRSFVCKSYSHLSLPSPLYTHRLAVPTRTWWSTRVVEKDGIIDTFRQRGVISPIEPHVLHLRAFKS